jgi:hypothetical protein
MSFPFPIINEKDFSDFFAGKYYQESRQGGKGVIG